MKKIFIFPISEIQVAIEADSFQEAQKEYEKTKEEASLVKTKIVKSPPKKFIKKGLHDYLLELKEEGFFVKPRTLRDIKEKLSELALHYPITSFPAYLSKLVKERELKRVKESKNKKEIWVYQDFEN